MKKWSIGFDAREMWNYDFQEMCKSPPGILTFLRDGITKPLSVDSSIWSSVFDHGDYPGLSDLKRGELGLGTLKLPDWTGPNMPFWEKLKQLKSYLHKNAFDLTKPYWIIAVAVIASEKLRFLDRDEWPHNEPTIPPTIDPAWPLIGYDILTKQAECALTGTTFEGDQAYIGSLKREWSPYINQYHLFQDIGKASEFSNMLDIEKQTHSPHCVYGIWLVEKKEEDNS